MKKNPKWAGFYLGAVLLLLYLPILVVVLFSFNANPGRTANFAFEGFSLQWYAALFDPAAGYGAALRTSLAVAAWSVGLSVIIGTLGAVGLARRRARRGLAQRAAAAALGAGEQLATLPIMLPEITLAIALMAMFSALRLPFGMVTLVLSHVVFCVPYIFITVRGRLMTLEPGLEEAARDLGATPVKALATVTLPLAFPAILSGSLLAFAMSMDDFVISFFVNGAETTTLPLKVYSSVKVGVPPHVNALCTVMLGAAFLLVALGQAAGGGKRRRQKGMREARAA
ncbi:MAG TPA: ABC transporter permease [Candidatus Limnocylindria bacterium]|nr:ABC transporter permease [Candidatus Limnocylindria bacterium]